MDIPTKVSKALRVDVFFERTTNRKVYRNLWSDDLEPVSYRTMSDNRALFIVGVSSKLGML